MKKLIILLFLSGCATQLKMSDFMLGCLVGTATTYQNITQDPWLEDWNMAAFTICEELEQVKNGQNL